MHRSLSFIFVACVGCSSSIPSTLPSTPVPQDSADVPLEPVETPSVAAATLDAISGDTLEVISETFWEEDVLPDSVEMRPTWDVNVEPYEFHERVQYYVDYFKGPARERFDIWLDRLPGYETMIRQTFRDAGLPEDLVYLGIVESGYSNTAISCAGAVGMWQFMYPTAQIYGLEVNQWIDERRDPIRATRAAAEYLADLTNEFGSHYLAAAAYNGGPTRVRRGIARLASQSSGPSDDTFFELASSRRYLHRETRDYVPKFIAAALIAKEPGRHGFEAGAGPEWRYDEVAVPDATGLDVMAELAETTVAEMVALNPQFIRGITPPGRTVRVRVPIGTGDAVTRGYAELSPTRRVNAVDHVIKRGETLSGLSDRYRVRLKAIQEANPGVSPRRLRVGQRLVIPTSGTVVPAVAWNDGGVEPRYPRRCGRTYRVRRGDTMGHIAQRFSVSLTALLRANRMRRTDLLRAGAVIRIPPR